MRYVRHDFFPSGRRLTKQRASDVNDIKNDLLSILLGKEAPSLSELAPNTVICAYDLVPSVTAGLDREHVAAILTETGGMTSHSAILARAMGIPAILGIPGVTAQLKNGECVIADAQSGTVLREPSESDIEKYHVLQAEYAKKQSELAAFIEKRAKTADGVLLEAVGNIGKPGGCRSCPAKRWRRRRTFPYGISLYGPRTRAQRRRTV